MKIRTIVLLMFLLIALYFLVSPLIFKKSGVVVTAVEKDGKCVSIREGSLITNILGSSIATSEDFRAKEKTVKANEYVTMIVNDGPGGCMAARDGYLGLTVSDVPSNRIKFGIDIQGGITTIIKPEKEINKTETENLVRMLNKRIEVYGMPETKAIASDGFIKISSLSTEGINWLIAEGKFEAKILEEAKFQDNVGKIPVGDGSYPVEFFNYSLKINNSFYRIGDEFWLEDIKFNVKNITNASAVIEATVFENKDIVKLLSSGSVSYNTNAKLYEFTIPIEISDEASSRFTKIVKRIPTTFMGEQILINGFLVYYIDGDAVSQLNIPFEFTRQKIKQMQIIGFSTNMVDASNTRLKILSSIESGVLPTTLKIVGTEKYEPTQKESSIEIFGASLGLVAVSVLSVFYWRYKSVKLGLLVVALSLVDLFLILGTIAAVQQLVGSTWVVNMVTIFGFIAVLFISSIQMILSSEQILKKKYLTISYKYRNLACVPMVLNLVVLTAGFVLLFTVFRFFGLTLLTGLVADVLLVRPVYSNFIKK